MRPSFRVLPVASAFALLLTAAGCTSLLGQIEVGGSSADGGSDGEVEGASEGGQTDGTVDSGTHVDGGDAGDAHVSDATTGDVVVVDSGHLGDASGGDSGVCTPGAKCIPTNPCHDGVIDCSGSTPTCKDQGTALPNGQTCGTNMVCNSGTCSACTANQVCTPTNKCDVGATDCSTGTQTCKDTGTAQPNGSSCGTGMVCETGMCNACVQNSACSPTGKACDVGKLDCTGSTPTCMDTGTQAMNGTVCGTNMVCDNGMCNACQGGVACTPTTECQVGTTSCTTGALVCNASGNANDTTSCTGGFCCGGQCDTTCTIPANASPSCSGTTCGFTCNPGFMLCNGACIASAPDTGAGVFVANGGGSGACGSESQPCGTIAAGLAAVASSMGAKTLMYLANGTYTEQVSLPAGLHVIGGWLDTGGTWTAQCVANPQSGAIIAAPANASTTVTASYSGTSTLDTLTIQSAPGASSGQSLMGIVAAGSSTILNLNNVDVKMVAAAGAGTGGTVGSNGTNGSGTCGTSYGTGATGCSGSNGAGAGPGTYIASGTYSPTTGGTAGAGCNGSAGIMPPAASCISYTNPCSDDGTCTGAPAGCQSDPTYQCCNKAAECGNPGTGSGPGSPGTGGGTNVAVFIGGATVTASGGTFTPGNGGNGGDGAAGGTPGTGSGGLSSTPGFVAASCKTLAIAGCKTCVKNTQTVCLAAPGNAPGGNGGQGGNGGGGSGGDSYCWYVLGGSMTAPSTGCTPATAGLGGSQGTPFMGANGTSAPHN